MIQLLFSLLCLVWAASLATAAGLGTVTFTNTQRYMFDVNGNQIDAVAAKVSCISPFHSFMPNCDC